MKRIIFSFLMVFSLCARSQQFKQLQLTEKDADTIIQQISSSKFSGNILIYQGDKKIVSYSKGLSNIEMKSPNNENLRFNVGSMGKPLTAILIMQLVEQGAINLDKPANIYLPDNLQLKYNSSVTVRQLLNMTSGLGDYFKSPNYSDTITKTVDLLKLVLAMKPVNDTPGLKYGYSNSGFIVLGAILENYYHKSYLQLLKEKIFQPAGIDYSKNSNLTTGYSKQDTSWVVGKDNNPVECSAAGGIYLTINEFDKIIKALNHDKYLRKETINAMWAKESHPETDPPFVNYGLGWMEENPGGIKVRGHNGAVRGFQCCFRYLPDDDVYIYVFSNHQNGGENIFMRQLFFLLGKKGFHFNG